MSETLTLFLLAGSLVGLASGSSDDADPRRGWAVVALACLAAVGTLAMRRWGSFVPRGAFHVFVAAGTLVVGPAVLLVADPVVALVCALASAFICVEACLFFALWPAVLHVAAALGAVTVALLVRTDLPVAVVIALDVLVLTLGGVTRRMVDLASTASLDPLTGLVNRRSFDEQLDELTARGGASSVALIDLDHFKQVNDTHGHEAGDRLLCEVASAWSGALPAAVVLARHGGDEFGLLLPGWNGPEAVALVRRLGTLHPAAGLSIGVAQAIAGESGAQLMRRADTALYAAKAGGRGRCALAGNPGPDLDPTRQ